MDLTRGLRSGELRRIAANRLHLRLEDVRDVHHECWFHRVFAIGERIEDLGWPVRLAAGPGRELDEAGEIAGIAAELRGDAMVRVPSDGEGEDHDAWPHTSDQGNQHAPRVIVIG